MLVMFDIDMTLISTGGAGMKSLLEAGRELFGGGFSAEGVSFAGRLDPLIISEMLVANGVADTLEHHGAMRTRYEGHLRRRLAEPGLPGALPGVPALLDALEREPGVTLGVLTGNFELTGSMKLRACGIDPERFTVRVWGDESPYTPPKREHLVPVGLRRWGAVRGRAAEPHEVTVIGDTPQDVHCAKVNGCRCLAVATGHFGEDVLLQSGADRVVKSLGETSEVVGWLLSRNVAGAV